MKTSFVLVLISLCFASTLIGAVHKIEMSFDALTLKNGNTKYPANWH